MKNYFYLLLLSTSFLVLCSFTRFDHSGFIGVYGVSDDNPSSIELSINADHSFSYFEKTSTGVIDVKGKWVQKGKKVFLDSTDKSDFHRVWSFTNDGQMAKSRKGLCFYSLCRK